MPRPPVKRSISQSFENPRKRRRDTEPVEYNDKEVDHDQSGESEDEDVDENLLGFLNNNSEDENDDDNDDGDEQDDEDDEGENGDEEDDEDDNDEEDDEDDDDEDEDDDAINNEEAMNAAIEDIRFMGGDAPWIESLQLNYPVSFTAQGVDANDDLQRELCFYQQALESAKKAQARFDSLGVAYIRPEDYFAEMLKSDSHMAKVRRVLLEQRQRIEAVEMRRRNRDLKKYGKKVQAEKQQAAAKQRSAEQEKIKTWRKEHNANNTLDGNDEFPIELAEDVAKRISDQPQTKQVKKSVSKKRQFKNEKYGFGGPKRDAKKNTRESSDSGSYNIHRNKAVDKDLHHLMGAQAKKSKKFKKNRPGKQRRQQTRSRSKGRK